MAVVYQHDKRSGLTYAYESIGHWDKDKKQSRSKRTLIGRVNVETGEIVPTDGRGKRSKQSTTESKPSEIMKRKYFGATYLFDEIGKKLGVTNILEKCFPETHTQILSLAYFLALEEESPLYRFEKWDILHKHPHDANITSQRSSDLFASITEEAKNNFFKLFAKRNAENEHWYYDATSISSFSETLLQAQYGNNKEGDRLPQINLGLIFGKNSNLPFYYRKYAGHIPDVSTIEQLLYDFEALGFRSLSVTIDRGGYSKDNVNLFLKKKIKFLLATKTQLKYVSEEIDNVYDKIKEFRYYNEQYELNSMTVKIKWPYADPRGKSCKTIYKPVYLHLYYNPEKATEEKKVFYRKLSNMRDELLNDKRLAKNETAYEKYFVVKKTLKNGIQVTTNEKAVEEATRYYGFFALLSNINMDSVAAIEIYRNKDLVEKTFGNIKDRLNQRRTLVSSEHSLNGKLFVVYIGLIYLSYIKKHMQEAELFKKYTISTLLDKLDVIECFEYFELPMKVGEITEKQRKLYEALKIDPPG
jgi:transposase